MNSYFRERPIDSRTVSSREKVSRLRCIKYDGFARNLVRDNDTKSFDAVNGQ